jgi:hypothetical protein
MKKRWWFLFGLGLAVSAVFLYLAFREVDWPELGRTLTTITPGYVVLSGMFVALSISLRALRWNYISDGNAHRYKTYWSAAAIGYFGNMVYPLRAGETLRVLAIKRLANVPIGHGTTSAVIDRLADGLALGFMLLVVGMIHGEDVLGKEAVDALRYTFIAGAIFLVAFGLWGRRWRGFFESVFSIFPQRAADLLLSWYDQAVALIVEVGKPVALLRIVVITLCAFAVDLLISWSVFQAFDWDLPLAAAFTTETFLAASSALPSAPAFVGVFQIASVLALALYGIKATSAVAFSIVLQVILLFVIVGQGLGVIARFGKGLASQTPQGAEAQTGTE